MVLISIDRYVAICCPLYYSTRVTQDKVMVCVALCWICSSVFQGLILREGLKEPGRYYSCVGECVFASSYITGLSDLTFSFIVPIAVIVVLYLRVFAVVASQSRAMRSHVADFALQSSVKSKTSQMKAAKTLGVVVATFLLCMCPYYCVALTSEDKSPLATFVVCLFYFNSCLNPIIYVFFYPWFRKSIRLISTLQILQVHSCDTNLL